MTWAQCENCNINVNLKGNDTDCPHCGNRLNVTHVEPVNPKLVAKTEFKEIPKAEPKTEFTAGSTNQDQPTYQQIQRLIEEVREIKNLLNVLRWAVPFGFCCIMFYFMWFGVKVNISPTLITPWSG